MISTIRAGGLLLLAVLIWAQEPVAQQMPSSEARADWQSKFWLSGQVNLVAQIYPSFPAAYSGPSSFRSDAQAKPTWVATIYTGYALTKNIEFIFDLESAKGAGVSGALGLGGLGNLDAVTDQRASAIPYVARAHFRLVVPLGKHMIDVPRNPLGLASTVPERRLEFRFGKLSLTDFFDLNSVGSDSHLQFLNYAIDNNAAYDIAANSRGYTYGALVELYQPVWGLRFAEAFEPIDNSGQRTDWNLSRSRSENVEAELHPNIGGKQPFTIRALAFLNHAAMGSYSEAVSSFLLGIDPSPDLSSHIRQRQSWGFGINGEAELPAGIRLFGRYGSNEGSKEIFQFAEVDRTLALGGDIDGRAWRRSRHRAGIAGAVNSIVDVHRMYLALGGQSYLLGDGALAYGREKVLEGYYNFPITRGVFGAFDVQRIWNPGYNQLRGPVIIFGLRLHFEGDLHFN